MTRQPLGDRLRAARRRKGLSLRELASRVGVSASLLSQVENGKSQTSVMILHSLVTALDITLDQLFDPQPDNGAGQDTGASQEPDRHRMKGPVYRVDDRPTIEMASGVTWERLSPMIGDLVDFKLVTYESGSTSSSDGRLTRHNGTELAYIVEGELTLLLGYDEYLLKAGDSLSFDSTTPHLYTNRSSSRVQGVWFEFGRRPEPGEERPTPEQLRSHAAQGE